MNYNLFLFFSFCFLTTKNIFLIINKKEKSYGKYVNCNRLLKKTNQRK